MTSELLHNLLLSLVVASRYDLLFNFREIYSERML